LSLLSKIKSRLSFFIKKLTFSPIKYWEERAQQYGERSVLNLALNEEEIGSLKDFQAKTIFPFLKQELNGTEQTLLDFGCGPGRLCIELANLTQCKVTGADPIEHLLRLAPADPDVSYKKITNGVIPVADNTFDVIWICFVLGGIVNKKEFKQTVKELERVAKKNSLLFLIENTTDKRDILSWKYRSRQDYINLFPNFGLVHLKDFDHGNELFSIMAGRNKSK